MMQAESPRPDSSANLEIQEKLKSKDIALLNCDLGEKESAGAYGRILLGMKTGVIRRYLALKWVNKEGAKQIELEALSEYIKYHKAQTNLITVHDVWGGAPGDDYLCYSMDLADDAKLGRAVESPEEVVTYKPDNLYTRMHEEGAKRVLPLTEINRYVTGLLDGLEHLEKLGLVHRDIKPENVLFLSGNAVLGDLGCMVKQGTEVWCGAGTWSYMSAEQRAKGLMDKCYCHEDLYQLGEVIYRLCLDFHVRGHQNYCYMAADKDGRPPPPMKPPLMEVPGVLTAYEAKLLNAFVTLHACAVEPENRFHSVAEFRAGWNELMENARDPERQARLLRQRKLRRLFQVANGVFVVLILALVGIVIAVRRAAPVEPTVPALVNVNPTSSFEAEDGRAWKREFIHDKEWFDPLQDILDKEWVVSSGDRRARLPEKPSPKERARVLELFWKGRELPEECEVGFILTMFEDASECRMTVSLEPVNPAAYGQSQPAVFDFHVTRAGVFFEEDEVFTEDTLPMARFPLNLVVVRDQKGGKAIQRVRFNTNTLPEPRWIEIPYCGAVRLRIRLASRSKGQIMLNALCLFRPNITWEKYMAQLQEEVSTDFVEVPRMEPADQKTHALMAAEDSEGLEVGCAASAENSCATLEDPDVLRQIEEEALRILNETSPIRASTGEDDAADLESPKR
ncbi:MAG: hypothetical protein IKS83_09860 [Victivallales bacterium]|nr:hypothetical protein [Victivallales bacterium]